MIAVLVRLIPRVFLLGMVALSVAHAQTRQQAYLKASNAHHGDGAFGGSVAVSGDTVIVGAWGESSDADTINGDQNNTSATGAGAAYVFVRSGTDWTQQAYLKASNSDAGDGFGASVAISGDTAVVGATGEDSDADRVDGDQSDNSASGAGAAYVFVRSGTTWTQQAYLKASNSDDHQFGDLFGVSVAISGDTVVVGAMSEGSDADTVNGDQNDNSQPGAGAAYVFVRSGSTWTQQAYLKASNSDSIDNFGRSVAVSGDLVIVGAVREDSGATTINGDQSDNSAEVTGAAYIYVRVGTTWIQEAYLKASNSDPVDAFGRAVAISGHTAVVGAIGEDSGAHTVNGDQTDNSANIAGAAYVFVRAGTTWAQEAYLKASNSDSSDAFGYSVAIANDTVVVGASGEDSDSDTVNEGQSDNSFFNGPGAAYVFVRSQGTWCQADYLKASNSDDQDMFGRSVGISGSTAIIGALLEDSGASGVNSDQSDNSTDDAGAAYIFEIEFSPFTDRCTGDGGDQMGCTECPCMNDAAPGTVGGCLNQQGLSARLLPSGSTSIAALDPTDLRFDLTGGNPGTLAVLASGDSLEPQNPMSPCFGLGSGVVRGGGLDGLNCVVGNVQRHGGRPTDTNGDVGLINSGWGGASHPPTGIAGTAGFVGGQTRYFQAIYRADNVLGCMTGQNTSQAVEVLFKP